MIQLANVKLIAAIICFSLFIRGHSALAVVIYRAAADVHKVLVEKRAVNFWRWAVDGNVNFFIGVFALSVGVYINSCSDYWAYKVGLVKTSSDKDNDSECVAAGAALAAIGWAGTMLNAYGRSHGWFTDNSASSAHAPKMKRGASILVQIAIILIYSVICLLIYRSNTTVQLIQYFFNMTACSTTT